MGINPKHERQLEMDAQQFSRARFLTLSRSQRIALVGSRLGAHLGSPALLRSLQGGVGAVPQMDMEPYVPDAEIALTAKEKWVQILPARQTRVWSYEGQFLGGTGRHCPRRSCSYLGPILRVESGKKVRIYFHNQLAEDSVIHPHGLRVPEDCDGHPMLAIGSGQTKIYEFQVIDRPGLTGSPRTRTCAPPSRS
jgi:FtsP/CotA-like multicopper oxidase with cupredoxin domain